jgi:coproporphyrinogen III oxidase-like Fe-S oxidoreductase
MEFVLELFRQQPTTNNQQPKLKELHLGGGTPTFSLPEI